jgi:hypothetical protein
LVQHITLVYRLVRHLLSGTTQALLIRHINALQVVPLSQLQFIITSQQTMSASLNVQPVSDTKAVQAQFINVWLLALMF